MKNLRELGGVVFFVATTILVALGFSLAITSDYLAFRIIGWIFFSAMIASGFVVELTEGE